MVFSDIPHSEYFSPAGCAPKVSDSPAMEFLLHHPKATSCLYFWDCSKYISHKYPTFSFSTTFLQLIPALPGEPQLSNWVHLFMCSYTDSWFPEGKLCGQLWKLRFQLSEKCKDTIISVIWSTALLTVRPLGASVTGVLTTHFCPPAVPRKGLLSADLPHPPPSSYLSLSLSRKGLAFSH